jgi:hypothetical protein
MLGPPKSPIRHHRCPRASIHFREYAAAIQLAGYAVTLAEPDIVVKDARRTVGIAAKRPHSLANLSNNLKKGAQQIQKAGLRGLVALDLSLIVGQNRRQYSDDFAGAGIAVQYLVDQFREKHAVQIQ